MRQPHADACFVRDTKPDLRTLVERVVGHPQENKLGEAQDASTDGEVGGHAFVLAESTLDLEVCEPRRGKIEIGVRERRINPEGAALVGPVTAAHSGLERGVENQTR